MQMTVRIIRPDGAMLDEQVEYARPVDDWSAEDLKSFAWKLRALLPPSDPKDWTWTLEPEGEIGHSIAIRAAAWNLRSSPMKLPERILSSEQPRWQDDPNWNPPVAL